MSGQQLRVLGDDCKGVHENFGGNDKVFYLGCGSGYTGRSPTCAFVKTHTIISLTWMHFIAYKLYLIKVDFKRRKCTNLGNNEEDDKDEVCMWEERDSGLPSDAVPARTSLLLSLLLSPLWPLLRAPWAHGTHSPPGPQ